MTWASGWVLWLLLGAPVIAVLAWLAHRRDARDLRRFAAEAVLVTLLSPKAEAMRTAQAWLAPVIVAGLVLGWAGPRLGFVWQQQKLEGVSIVAVLDVSRSMDAQDVSPSRLVAAKRDLNDLGALVRGDAVGLVLFAQGAWMRIPLTTDTATWRWALDDTSTETMRAQGTSLSGALLAAIRLFEAAEGAGKAIVLVSDGEDHDDDAAMDAAVTKVVEAGVRVYALGVGTPEGAPVPVPEGGFKKDDDGAVVLSKLNEARLRSLAGATGGAYVRAVPGDSDVRALYEDEIRGKLAATERGVRRDKLWNERFQWPLGAALIAMVSFSFLGVGRARPRS